jgi:Periplasmic binding protein
MLDLRRRQFITLLGGAAAWPVVARAQQGERVRRISVLVPAAANDPVWQARIGVFQQALALSGWIIGRNVQIDIRWATTDAAAIRREAEELAALAPDVILAAGHSSAAPLLQATRTLPIVFTLVQDAVAAGFVDSLARPGGNATGFTSWEFSMGAKWLELLKQIASGLTRVAVLRDASQGFAVSQFVAIQTVAPSLGVEVTKGQLIATSFFEDVSPAARKWSDEFSARRRAMPSQIQAGVYSAVRHYLQAVKDTDSDDGPRVMARMKATRISDAFTPDGTIRADQRMVHDMYLVQVKTPAESKGPWDLVKLVTTVPPEEAFRPLAESKCPLVAG